MMKQSIKPIILVMALLLPMVACKDNGTGTGGSNGNMNSASLSVEDQGTSNGNTITIPSASIEESGWVVIHRDAGGSPQVPDIIGKAMLDAGSNSNISVQLDESVSDGETLWAMLHKDTGTKGKYEFTGSNSPDQPVTVDGDILTKPFTINQTDPSVTSEDQVNKGGVFTANVNAAEAGWIVIHRSNSSGDGPQVPEIIAKAHVSAGTNGEVEIPLNDGETVETGEKLWPMLHYDTGTKGKYEFDGQNGLDLPVIFDGDIVLSSFTVLKNQSSLTAMDQTVMNNSITVDVDADAAGWVVVHRDAGGGPEVPPIIGKAQVSKGMNKNVKIAFGDSVVSDGEILWPMVHYDTGTIGKYEFDGQNGLDLPMVVDGSILTKSITVSGSGPSVTANDQVAASELTIAEVDAEQIGFIVLHRDDNGSPGAVFGHAQVYTGSNTDVSVPLDEGESVQSGEKVWAMLHIDNGEIGAYEFDGSQDSNDPPVKNGSGQVVMVQFTIQ